MHQRDHALDLLGQGAVEFSHRRGFALQDRVAVLNDLSHRGLAPLGRFLVESARRRGLFRGGVNDGLV